METTLESLDIAVVILHYMNFDDTIACVESFLENLDASRFLLVVVDNASPNESGKLLSEKYETNNHVKVICNEKNLGFSAGNNIGINYVRNNFNVDFLVVSNNDILLLDKQLFHKIKDEFSLSKYAVMGPLILSGDGKYTTNPIFDLPYTLQVAKSQLQMFKRKLKRYNSVCYPLNLKLYNLFCKIARKLWKKTKSQNNRKLDLPLHDAHMVKRFQIVLHGCFLIFSPEYLLRFDGLDARTFLYAEEDILYQHIIKEDLIIEYNPEIIIYHKEDGSVNKISKSDRQKQIFVTENAIKAIEAYIEFLDELEEKK